MINVHFLSSRCQTFVSLMICISPWYTANFAHNKKASPTLHEEKKLVPSHYYNYCGAADSNRFLDLC
jgi:hypothetical protein